MTAVVHAYGKEVEGGQVNGWQVGPAAVKVRFEDFLSKEKNYSVSKGGAKENEI